MNKLLIGKIVLVIIIISLFSAVFYINVGKGEDSINSQIKLMDNKKQEIETKVENKLFTPIISENGTKIEEYALIKNKKNIEIIVRKDEKLKIVKEQCWEIKEYVQLNKKLKSLLNKKLLSIGGFVIICFFLISIYSYFINVDSVYR